MMSHKASTLLLLALGWFSISSVVFGWTLDDLKPCLSKAEVQDQSDGSTIRTELETCLPSSRPCGCNNSDLWNDLYSFIEPDSSPFDLKLKFNDTNSMTLKLIPLCDDWMPEDPKKAYECVPGYKQCMISDNFDDLCLPSFATAIEDDCDEDTWKQLDEMIEKQTTDDFGDEISDFGIAVKRCQ